MKKNQLFKIRILYSFIVMFFFLFISVFDSNAEEETENVSYTVSVCSNGNGKVLCQGSAENVVELIAGSDVSIQIVPLPGNYVAGLMVDGMELEIGSENVTQSENGSYSYAMYGISSAHSISVNFAEIPNNTVDTPEQAGLILQEGNATNVHMTENEEGINTYFLSSEQYLVIMPQDVEQQILVGQTYKDRIEVHNTISGICDSVTIRKTTGSFGGSVECYQISREYNVVVDNGMPRIQGRIHEEWLRGNGAGLTLYGTVSDNESGVAKVVWFDHEATEAEITAEISNTALVENGAYSISGFNVLFPTGVSEKVYYFYVVDCVGNYSYDTVTYKLDREPPEVSFVIEDSFIEEDSYFVSDNCVHVRVNAHDRNGSGVSRVSLSVNGIEYASQQAYGSANITFDVHLSDSVTDIMVYAYDYVGNVISVDSQGNKIYLDENKPELSVVLEGICYTTDDILYCTEDVLFYIDYCEGAESDAGLAHASVCINGTVITTDVSQNSISSNYLSEETIIWEDSFVISTAQVSAPDNIYFVEISIMDKAGNIAEYTCEIHKDNEAPEILSYSVNGRMADGTIISVEESGGIQGDSECYRFFSSDNITVNLNIRDNDGGVGVDSISYRLRDDDGACREMQTVQLNGNGEISIGIPADFKGDILIGAKDLIGNEMPETLCICGLVVESRKHFELNSHIVAKLPETTYTDLNGVPLYAGDVSIPIEIKDDFSGIRKLEWSIVSGDIEVENGVITVDADGRISGDSGRIISRDGNMVTGLMANIGVSENSNAMTVHIKMTNGIGYTEEQDLELSIDKTNPIVSIELEGGLSDSVYTNIYHETCMVTINVLERNFVSDNVILQVNSSGTVSYVTPEWLTEDNTSADERKQTAVLSFMQDGIYEVSVIVTDKAGNSSEEVLLDSFVVDQTVPQIEVTFDNDDVRNNAYYDAGRVATIYVEEENFDASRISVSGNAENGNFPELSDWQQQGRGYVAYLSFDEDGMYSFAVQGQDKAGNEASDVTVEKFYIDTVAPNVIIEGIENMSANNGAVIPVIEVQDDSYDSTTLQIYLTGANNGEIDVQGVWSDTEKGQVLHMNDFPYTEEMDDMYTLEVLSEDLAGNSSSTCIQFSINRFGSVYTMSSEVQAINGTYMKTPIDIVITETNIDRLQPDSIALVLTINGVPYTLEAGTDYEVVEQESETSWKQYMYRIYRECCHVDGAYSLAIYSMDEAGNINENRNESKCADLRFGVDRTAPIVMPLNIENYGIYDASSLIAEIAIADNLLLKQVTIELDGETVEYQVVADQYHILISEGDEVKNLRVIAYDEAGNVTLVEVSNFIVSSNPFVRWYNDKVTFWLSIVGMIGVVSVVGFVVRRKGR